MCGQSTALKCCSVLRLPDVSFAQLLQLPACCRYCFFQGLGCNHLFSPSCLNANRGISAVERMQKNVVALGSMYGMKWRASGMERTKFPSENISHLGRTELKIQQTPLIS